MAKTKSTPFGDAAEQDKPIEQIYDARINDEQNTVIFGEGLRSVLESLLSAGDVEKAKKMFACHHDEAMEAISQYDSKLHKINEREDKERLDKEDYETAKLSRPLQKGTNQVGTFFMFGNQIDITLSNKPEEADELSDAFETYLDYLDSLYFHELMYETRRITGAETECAKLYSLVKDEDGNVDVVCQIKSNGNKDILYPLFNQYGKLVAFAFGYVLRNLEGKLDEHFDVYTKKTIWKFLRPNGKGSSAWTLIEKRVNEFDKIPVIYYNHEVDWDGAQPSIDQLEWRASKHSDTVEYFGDPYLLITADIANNRLADAKEVGKVIVMDNEQGRFEYVTPPDSAEMVKNETEALKASIGEDTLTPDWSYKSIMGLGTLSGEAMRRANLPGYVKRTQFAVGTYNKMIRRELNLIRDIMCNYVYLSNSDMVNKLRRMKIKFDYTDPFIGGIEDNSTEIATMVGAGAMSIHAAVAANRYIKDKQAEEDRIWEEIERKAMIEAKAKAAASTSTNSNTEE